MEREQLNFFLQHADQEKIFSLCRTIEDKEHVERIQKPTHQTLLVPVRDPINQGSFISGEVLVTSAIIQLRGVNGWSMIMDDNRDLADALALLDGAYAAGIRVEEITSLASSGRERIENENRELTKKVRSTCVAFDLL